MKWILKKFQMEDCNNVDTPFRNLYENTLLALLVVLSVVSFCCCDSVNFSFSVITVCITISIS